MSAIRFESAREKEKIREDLREARAQLLEKAKKNAERQTQRNAESVLRGENDWMLPAVAAQIDKSSGQAKIAKRKKKKHKDSEKRAMRKAEKKKRKRQNSSSSEQSDGSGGRHCSSKPGKRKKKTKKHVKRKSTSKRREETDSDSSSSSATEDTSDGDVAWVERPTATQPPREAVQQQRDSWMTEGTLALKTFQRERPTPKTPNEQQQPVEAYDPVKSARELNPYWKSTGTGLPGFQKPREDDDDDDADVSRPAQRCRSTTGGGAATRSIKNGWQKRGEQQSRRSPTPVSSGSSADTDSEAAAGQQPTGRTTPDFLTDQQMNELGAKILKAEIVGNLQLAAELKAKLERARDERVSMKARVVGQPKMGAPPSSSETEKHVLLTRTDERGNCRPLAQTGQCDLVAGSRPGGRRGGRKQHSVETHANGERVRYFPDDDKYDIKQMFAREKYASAADSNLQFAAIAGRSKQPGDDLEDIFADAVRRGGNDEAQEAAREQQRAIHEEQRQAKRLENCDRCYDSSRMDKRLLVALGAKAYLALPAHVGLQPGHCVIAAAQHVSCCTQADEDTWAEIGEMRGALTRMFRAQRQDVIFYEIANKLQQRRPHLVVHCIPVPERVGELAPFYFKKAIEESEQEWSVNRQLVVLRGGSGGGLRSAIPNGLDYVWVHFGMDSGFAHVIEDQNRFPANFATEIIAGMLQLEASAWRKPPKEQNAIAKVKLFAEAWKKYDCTN